MPEITPREVRQLIQQHLCELADPEAKITAETLLIRGGEYCGHRFQSDALTAIWFLEEKQIKFYSADGRVIRSMSTDCSSMRRDAA